MKRLSLTLGAIALLATACQPSPKEFKLTASGLSDNVNGTYAVVYNLNQEPIDSIAIKDGGFVYSAAANDTLAGAISIADNFIVFNYEAGDFTLTQNEEGMLVRGGDGNSTFMKAQAFNNDLKALSDEYEPMISEKYREVTASETPNEEQVAELTKLQEDYEAALKGVYNKYYTKGGNTAVDYLAFSHMYSVLTPAEYVEYYEGAGSIIKNNKRFEKMYQLMQAAVKTDVGGQFVDYQITNPAGDSKMLNEFREEGKYFLLDFFASWCPPCKRSMPVIAELEKEYAKIFTSASIAIWERDSDGAAYAEAVKNLKITWPTMQDAQSTGAELYGVAGVPTFVLFSPEGEIILRGHDIEAVKTKLAELATK